MKLLTPEEVDAHWYVTAAGGLKGLIAGSLVSLGIFKYGHKKWPKFPKNLPWSIRTAIAISPPTAAITIWAEEASNSFDREMYHGDSEAKQKLEEYNQWAKLPWNQKLVGGCINHKYKIIVGAWAASMYGSWVYVNRDKIMSKTQKLVQARMYAQFLTVILLLASVGLSVYDEKNHPEHYNVTPKMTSWEKVLKEEEERLSEASSPSYKRTRIYKD